MKCHHCDSQATVHLTQIINGQMHKMDLCESCAQEKGVTNPDNLSIGNLLDDNQSISDPSFASMTCESCGTTHQDFKKGGDWAVKHAIMSFVQCLNPCLMVCTQGLIISERCHPVVCSKKRAKSRKRP